MSKSIFSAAALARASLRKSGALISASPRVLRWALRAVRMKVRAGTPGISVGYWNDRNTPLAARSLGARASRSSPSRVTDPAVGSYPGRPARA